MLFEVGMEIEDIDDNEIFTIIQHDVATDTWILKRPNGSIKTTSTEYLENWMIPHQHTLRR